MRSNYWKGSLHHSRYAANENILAAAYKLMRVCMFCWSFYVHEMLVFHVAL